MKYGCDRVSTDGQSPALQRAALKGAVQKIFEDEYDEAPGAGALLGGATTRRHAHGVKA